MSVCIYFVSFLQSDTSSLDSDTRNWNGNFPHTPSCESVLNHPKRYNLVVRITFFLLFEYIVQTTLSGMVSLAPLGVAFGSRATGLQTLLEIYHDTCHSLPAPANRAWRTDYLFLADCVWTNFPWCFLS